MIVAWGEKIGLRPFTESLTDSEVRRIYQWSRDGNILSLSGGTPTELTLGEFRDQLQRDRTRDASKRRVYFVVTHEGELIGRAGCFAIDDQDQQGELGIVIGESAYWDKGYGRDAVITLLSHLFATTSLEKINLFTFANNIRAQRCFAACGFREVGRAPRFSPEVGEFDGIEMEITRSDFAEQHQLHVSKIPMPEELK